jgi:uncharacterized protein YjcR
MEYNFPKALYRYKELLEVLPVSSSTVDRWKAE